MPFFRVSTQSVKFSNMLYSFKRALRSMGCIKFVYTEHKYKSSCSRSQYGEWRIVFFLLLRLWINSFGFTLWMKPLNSPFCVVYQLFFTNFEKWNLWFFETFHIGKLFRVKRLKWIALSLIVRISACQARCLACCFVWFHHLLSPEISVFTHRCNNIHSSLKSKIQSQKDA